MTLRVLTNVRYYCSNFLLADAQTENSQGLKQGPKVTCLPRDKEGSHPRPSLPPSPRRSGLSWASLAPSPSHNPSQWTCVPDAKPGLPHRPTQGNVPCGLSLTLCSHLSPTEQFTWRVAQVLFPKGHVKPVQLSEWGGNSIQHKQVGWGSRLEGRGY